MARKIMIALSNPVSRESDAEFNDWYNNVHGPELKNLDGFRSMTRYRAVAQPLPPGQEPQYQYLAVYELDDIDTALGALAASAAEFEISPTLDTQSSIGLAFEQIFTTEEG